MYFTFDKVKLALWAGQEVYIYAFTELFPDLNLSTMFLLRSRMFVGRLFRVTGSSLAETGPRVSAVKLMHTIQLFNNGEIFVILQLS